MGEKCHSCSILFSKYRPTPSNHSPAVYAQWRALTVPRKKIENSSWNDENYCIPFDSQREMSVLSNFATSHVFQCRVRAFLTSEKGKRSFLSHRGWHGYDSGHRLAFGVATTLGPDVLFFFFSTGQWVHPPAWPRSPPSPFPSIPTISFPCYLFLF